MDVKTPALQTDIRVIDVDRILQKKDNVGMIYPLNPDSIVATRSYR